MHCVDAFPVDEFVRVTFSIIPRLISSFSRVLKKRRSVLVGFSNPFDFMNMKRRGEVRETHEGYNQVLGHMCVIGGVQKQFGNPTTKYVKVRKVECVDGPKIHGLFGLGNMLPGLDSGGVFLFVAFLTDVPPHQAGIVEVLEDTEVPSDTCTGKFDSVVYQRAEILR